MNPAQGRQVKMTMAELEALPDVTCKECGFDNFIQTYKVKKVSLIMSQTGRPEVVPIQTFICAKCKTQLTPKDMENLENEANKSEPELPDNVIH